MLIVFCFSRDVASLFLFCYLGYIYTYIQLPNSRILPLWRQKKKYAFHIFHVRVSYSPGKSFNSDGFFQLICWPYALLVVSYLQDSIQTPPIVQKCHMWPGSCSFSSRVCRTPSFSKPLPALMGSFLIPMRVWGEFVLAWVLSCVWLFATPWSVALQAPLSMGFPGKNTGVGCHFLLQGIFLSQGSNPCFLPPLHWQTDSLPLSHVGLSNCYAVSCLP